MVNNKHLPAELVQMMVANMMIGVDMDLLCSIDRLVRQAEPNKKIEIGTVDASKLVNNADIAR